MPMISAAQRARRRCCSPDQGQRAHEALATRLHRLPQGLHALPARYPHGPLPLRPVSAIGSARQRPMPISLARGQRQRQAEAPPPPPPWSFLSEYWQQTPFTLAAPLRGGAATCRLGVGRRGRSRREPTRALLSVGRLHGSRGVINSTPLRRPPFQASPWPKRRVLRALASRARARALVLRAGVRAPVLLRVVDDDRQLCSKSPTTPLTWPQWPRASRGAHGHLPAPPTSSLDRLKWTMRRAPSVQPLLVPSHIGAYG